MPLKSYAITAALAFASLFSANAKAEVDLKEASVNSRWLRLYQYKEKHGGYKSDVTSDRFFFSSNGSHDPESEMRAAIDAYSDPRTKFGTQNDSAACVFPFRKKTLESLLNKKFPSPACPDLEKWVKQINADHLNLVFVGAFPGNPASILGHTFLRLSNRTREASGREGLDLLSYSVGFLAQADPRDNRMMYMLKGLTGGYPGFYEIEPHYMKVGLYNNSESRDLWDLPLDLSRSEVDDLVRYFWELTFNASFGYYFIDENCSYRLLTLIEAVRPETDLSSKLSFIVLPAETVRVVRAGGLSHEPPKFRPSVKRRLEHKTALLDEKSRSNFLEARSSIEATKQISDPTEIDALLDFWLYANYKVKTQLDDKSKALMEATYKRASEVKGTSRYLNLSTDDVRNADDLVPPYDGHKPSWVEVRAGHATPGNIGGLSYRNGVHPFWSGDRAYEGVSGIEYLGFDVDAGENAKPRASLLLAKASAFENFASLGHPFSWNFEASLTNHCLLCRTDQAAIEVIGGYGFGISNRNWTGYLLPSIRLATWMENGTQGLSAPGGAIGVRFASGEFTLLIEGRSFWWRDRRESSALTRATYSLQRDLSVFISGTNEDLTPGASRAAINAGLDLFF